MLNRDKQIIKAYVNLKVALLGREELLADLQFLYDEYWALSETLAEGENP